MASESGPHPGRAGASYYSGASNAEDVAWPQDTSRPYCCRELGKVLMVREPSNDATEIATVAANHSNTSSFGEATEMHIRQGAAQKCRPRSKLSDWLASIHSFANSRSAEPISQQWRSVQYIHKWQFLKRASEGRAPWPSISETKARSVSRPCGFKIALQQKYRHGRQSASGEGEDTRNGDFMTSVGPQSWCEAHTSPGTQYQLCYGQNGNDF